MAPVITVIVGHRGSGKTQFLRRAEAAFAEAGRDGVFVDIDAEIERNSGQPITELFPAIGETPFRAMEERQVGLWITKIRDVDQPGFIAVGAGYQGDLPTDVDILWVQRATDGNGRIFLDRPALDPKLTPLDEFATRHAVRQPRFDKLATSELLVGEGGHSSVAERLLLGLETDIEVGGWLTLLPRSFRRWDSFIATRKQWEGVGFEVRDDLIDAASAELTRTLDPTRVMLSYRIGPGSYLEELRRAGNVVDWALELGPPQVEATVLSLHDRADDETIGEAGRRLAEAADDGQHLKLAVMVSDFDDLASGHRWWSEDPEGRSFLPRSDDGQWGWYRRRQRGRMAINFFREGAGSAPDQPTLGEWVATPPASDSFAAIVGDPVAHSRTPAEQAGYFADRSMPVLRVRIPFDDFSAHAESLLRELGLTHAAVTSPLKEAAHVLCREVTAAADEVGAVNTLLWDGDGWVGTNTDVGGLAAVTADVPDDAEVVLWGGGGTRSAVLAQLPKAVAYSARQGEPVDEGQAAVADPDIVVWAVGRHRQAECTWPPTDWKPSQVIDLNYTEDSPGLEYARAAGADYRSGIEMFRAQAQGQREFWNGR